jgi:hypothetical protein
MSKFRVYSVEEGADAAEKKCGKALLYMSYEASQTGVWAREFFASFLLWYIMARAKTEVCMREFFACLLWYIATKSYS